MKRYTKIEQVQGWLLLLPALVLLSMFTYYPTIATFIGSFFSNKTVIKPQKFIGFDNYVSMLKDEVFLTTLKNTFYYALTTVPVSITLALIMALLINRNIRAKGIMRLAYFTPTILPMVAVANIWLFFYSPDIGLLNKLVSYFGFEPINWLGDPKTVLDALVAMTIWKEAGFFMIFYLAAFQSLPRDLYEAAKIDGASSWRSFWKITFPLVMPTTFFIMINALLNAFKTVDQLFILTKGGPDNASNLLLYYIYETAFSFFDYSYAAALTILLLLILVLLSLFQFTIIEKRIHYK
ncbi:MAG TPA: sugar ABC transporter permease [Nitratifractor sp.]|jgi:sn-glycerol 3-phosphate transport system permease protein|nr:sugar ABC transporter permease [Nitratifractor sp.]